MRGGAWALVALTAMLLPAGPGRAAAHSSADRLPPGIDLGAAACAMPTDDGAPDPDCRPAAGTAETVWGAARAAVAGPAGPLPCVEIDDVDDRCEAWTVSRDESPVGEAPAQFPSDLALSPDGGTVYAAIQEQRGLDPWESPSDWLIAAHDAAGGTERWVARIDDLLAQSFPSAIAVAPDGDTVYVAGSNREAFGDGQSSTVVVAFDASTGAERWRAEWDGPSGIDNPRTLVAHETGVYVAVISANGSNGNLDYVLWALEHDGETRFATRWGTGGLDSPFDLAVAPDGTAAYLTGKSAGPGEFNVDYGTVAFATTGEDAGEIAWTARYDGEEGHAPDEARAIAADEEHVYVTGYSNDLDAGDPFEVNYEFATLAYDRATGELAWEARRTWGADPWSPATEMALDAGRVFVAGMTTDFEDADYATLALDAATGAEIWANRYELEGHDLEVPLAIAADGGRAYVTGISSSSHTAWVFLQAGVIADQATVAYDGATGARAWIARYNDSGYDDSAATGIVAGAGRVVTMAQLVRNIEAQQDFHDAGLAAYDA